MKEIFVDGSQTRVAVWCEDFQGIKILDRKYTTNMGEYIAVFHGIQCALLYGYTNIKIISDSQLVINQLKGIYKARCPQLRGIRDTILTMYPYENVSVEFEWQPRNNPAGIMLE